MEQAESNPDSPRVFTREKWFVQLGTAARGIACCSKCGTSGRIVMQVAAFKLPACSRVTSKPEIGHCLSREIVVRCSGFEENLDNAVSHFKLLRVALYEKRINALADISWVFFSFQ